MLRKILHQSDPINQLSPSHFQKHPLQSPPTCSHKTQSYLVSTASQEIDLQEHDVKQLTPTLLISINSLSFTILKPGINPNIFAVNRKAILTGFHSANFVFL